MKKLFLSLLGVTALFSVSQAQDQTTAKDKYLNAGVGLAAYTAGGVPVGASFEIGIKENISVGGFVDYARYGYRSGGYKWNYNFLYFGARGSYHLSDVLAALELGNGNSKFDPYGGLSVGLRTVSYNDNTGSDISYNHYGNGMFVGFHAGTRYFFTEKIGGFAEVGYGVSALKLGVTAKF
ncbi:hypothetical protein [Botryobacter ruber]|uniref:hypothetical protein n=1 Tax=Botryobacter ruber TaxID=2171629 RepID=UPI000E09E0CD|nr:hypothetical protein [Botryobacter ruber]